MTQHWYAIFDGNEKGDMWKADELSAVKVANDMRAENPKVELLKLERDGTVIERVYLD